MAQKQTKKAKIVLKVPQKQTKNYSTDNNNKMEFVFKNTIFVSIIFFVVIFC